VRSAGFLATDSVVGKEERGKRLLRPPGAKQGGGAMRKKKVEHSGWEKSKEVVLVAADSMRPKKKRVWVCPNVETLAITSRKKRNGGRDQRVAISKHMGKNLNDWGTFQKTLGRKEELDL